MRALRLRSTLILPAILAIVPFLTAQSADEYVKIVGSSVTLPVRVTNATPISVNMSSPAAVTVNNTTPVPISGNVAVTNTVPISGTVNVNGTVPVELSGTPTVNLGSGTSVKLDTASALPIHDLDHPARQPVYLRASGAAEEGGSDTRTFAIFMQNNSSFVVPANKMLVVEFVSGTAIYGSSDTLYWVMVSAQGPSSGHAHYVAVPPPLRANSETAITTFSQSVKLYAHPGEGVVLVVLKGSTNRISIEGYLTGYLVDCDSVAGCPAP